MIAIHRAATTEDFAIARALFQEYQRAIGVDLCFQSFEHELTVLAEMYGPPDGALLLAIRSTNGEPAGCVALRRLGDGVCEMKRLYVRSDVRGHGLGRALVDALLAEARRLGYRCMRLNTLEAMTEARALYASLGFTEIAPYNDHAVEGTRFMERTI